MKDSIVQIGDLVLKGKASPVPLKDIPSKAIQQIIAKMKKALEPEKNGVAIAAPQVGESLQIFIISQKVFADAEWGSTPDAPSNKELHTVFINPEIIRASRKKWEVSEGCLSVREIFGTVMRSEKATIKALDEKGKSFTLNGSGLLAQIFQHEVDHLNGILFVEKALKIDDPDKLRAKFSVRRKKRAKA